jgi:cell division protein FtsB
VGLIASIPFDFILVTAIPGSGLLRYLRLFKLSRVFLLSSRLQIIKDLCRKTGLHKILGGLLGTAILFTILFYIFGPTYGGFDDFYFVIVTLTTVGYGDVTPVTYNEKVLAIILILIGIFVFSTITAAMSSFLTDRILDDDEKDIKSEINGTIEDTSENIMSELKVVREENNGLKDEINGLKDEINGLKDEINGLKDEINELKDLIKNK